MKNLKITLLSLLLLLLNIASLQAHALYIDTQPIGGVGKVQEAKVYYSEFEDRTVEKVADWYSDVAKFELWLIQPDGESIKLSTSPQEDHFVTNFTPEKEGKYRLQISHMAADPGKETAYQFNAFAEITVGKQSQTSPLASDAPDLVLLEQPSAENLNVKTFKTYFKGEPAEGISATLFLPSGTKQTVVSGANGNLEVKLEEKGTYFLEATTFQKDEAGNTGKADYGSVWRCATQKMEVI